MRPFLVLVVVAAVLAPAGLGSTSTPRTLAVKTTVTGEITRLGVDRIAIGRVGCAIPTKLEVQAGRFVVSDPVRISCLNGKLQSVKYSPELATAQSDRPGGNASTTVPTPAPSPRSGTTTSAYSIGVFYFGGSPPGETTTVTGQISDVSSTSVTVAGLTCTVKAPPNLTLFPGPAVGDNVNLTCTGGLLIRLASVSLVQR